MDQAHRRTPGATHEDDVAVDIYEHSLSTLSHADFLAWCQSGMVQPDDESGQVTETVEQISACNRLLLMVLRMAIIDLILWKDEKDQYKRNQSEDARFWFYHPGPREGKAPYLLSFPSLCEIMEVDAASLRARIMNMTVDDLKRLYRYGS